jgi:hypothetical protein
MVLRSGVVLITPVRPWRSDLAEQAGNQRIGRAEVKRCAERKQVAFARLGDAARRDVPAENPALRIGISTVRVRVTLLGSCSSS